MLREKRITKQPAYFFPLYPEPKKQPNKSTNRRRKMRCEFKMLPLPAKYHHSFTILPLCGVKLSLHMYSSSQGHYTY